MIYKGNGTYRVRIKMDVDIDTDGRFCGSCDGLPDIGNWGIFCRYFGVHLSKNNSDNQDDCDLIKRCAKCLKVTGHTKDDFAYPNIETETSDKGHDDF